VCLEGTRVALLEDIWSWINAANHTKSAEIFLLSDLAGTGKTAIAHTVAKRCHEADILASSFFFDRDVPEKSGPQRLFTSIARDLSFLSKDVLEHINLVLERDLSVASASPHRQFEQLILNPFHLRRFDRPIVIVIDALDEGYDPELLRVLREGIPELSGSFRIFITSRPEDDIITDLSAPHVRRGSIDINGTANQRDIALYCKDRLSHIASRKHLDAGWPGPQLLAQFQEKAEGLFVWVSAVSEYLSSARTFNPDGKLVAFLSNPNLSGFPAETKMNKLYSEILKNCDWSDEEFIDMYKLVVGSIMALKTPLSASALQTLHRRDNSTLQVFEVLRPLSSLFIGLSDESQHIHVLHHSFRDFLTSRAPYTQDLERFYINEKHHSQRLALLCLSILCEDLDKDIPGTGYLTEPTANTKGIPEIADEDISEALWYACRFWSEHVLDVDEPVSGALLDTLRDFLSNDLIRWMEVLNAKGRFQGLAQVREWLQVCS
jgi:hypothetical protein